MRKMFMIGLKDFEALMKVIEELRIKSDNGSAILVEGKKDRIALRNLGIRGDIIEISSIPNSTLADMIGEREAIILTDWDERGEKILKQIAGIISFKDLKIRKRIISITGKYIHSVEELPTFIEKAERILRNRF